MKDNDASDLNWDDWDEHRFPRLDEQDFDRVAEAAISRRGFLGGVVAFGSGAAAMGTGLLSSTSAEAQAASNFPFIPIAAQTDVTLHVPDGYSWKVTVRSGDPLFSDADGYDVTVDGGGVEGSDVCSVRAPTAWKALWSMAKKSSPSTANM